MLRKTVTRSFMALACAAAFTLVPAQYSWESGGSGDSSSSSESASSDESSSEASPYEYGSSSGDGAGSAETSSKAAKPKKEKSSAPPAGFSTQKSCPVCNSPKIKRNLYAEHSGQRIHVCSAACIGRVQRNPEAFVKILEKRGESPEK